MSEKFSDTPLKWRKSSKSGNDSDKTDCVEVAFPSGEEALLRDSKNPNGGVFRFSAAGWAAFLAAVSKSDTSSSD